MDIDASQVLALADSMQDAIRSTPKAAKDVVLRGGGNIQRQMKAEAAGVGHAPKLPSDITMDTVFSRGGFRVEVGPTTGDVGSLALLYYGNSRTGPRLPDPTGALEAEAPNVERYLAELAEKALR